MQINETQTTRKGFSLALLSILAVLTIVSVRLQAGDTTNELTNAAGHCAKPVAVAPAAPCHGAAAAATEPNTVKSCCGTASEAMKGCPMHAVESKPATK